MGSVPLKRIGGLARAATILVGAGAAVSLLAVLATRAATSDAQAFLDDELSRDDFRQSIAPMAILSLLQGLVLVASAVVVIVWMYRVASNLRMLHRGTTWAPGWSIGGWFAPPLLNLIPFLVLREQWKASDPEVPVGGDWRSGSSSPLITAWFVVFGPVQVAIFVLRLGDTFSGFGGNEEVVAEQVADSLVVPTISAVADVAAAILFILVARGLTARHCALTGERA
jgi:hypothetical protein